MERGVVLFEVDELGPSVWVSDEPTSFAVALEGVRPAEAGCRRPSRELALGAVEGEFGLKLTDRAGGVFAKVATEGPPWGEGG